MNAGRIALHSNGEVVMAFEPIQPIRTWGKSPATRRLTLETVMKKVLLISVSVLALSAGAAFAGSPNGAPSGWLTQPSAVTPVSPAGAVSPGNTSIVGQNGSGNQIGTSSNWGVDQSVDGSSGNYSNIQHGSSISTSTGAKATVSQTSTSGGGSTTSTVIQRRWVEHGCWRQ